MGFSKADEAHHYTDDGTDRTFITVLPSLAFYSVSLLTLSQNYAIAVTELDEGSPGFQHLTEEEIAVYVLKASAMDEASHNELDKPQESTIKK
jgi:hypothetical protein